MQVYVLLFNVDTENEGIHTLKLKDGDRDVVLMFESEDDAVRYGLLLEAQDFLSPSVECLDSEEIEEFCKDAKYEPVFVPTGMLAVPPETNLEETDWKPEQARSPEAADAESEPVSSGLSNAELERIRRQLEGLL